MNSQYTFDQTYLMCVSENMDKIGPFGEVPTKMASSVKRSMVAARAMLKAVKSAFEIANELKSVSVALLLLLWLLLLLLLQQ
jgi:hypothetical protein